MGRLLVIVIGLVLLVSLLLFSATYTVKYHQVGIKTRFGKATDSVITEAGLGFKWPSPIDKVILLDRRLQMLETPLETIQTTDGQQLVVRAFLLWRVDDVGEGPKTFFESFPSAEEASDSLRNEFRTHVKNGVSQFRFNELIGGDSRIEQAEQRIAELMASATEKGIVPVSVGFSQVSLPATTTGAVIGRMHAERKKLAEIERIKGSAESQRIRSEATIDAEKIRAFANQRSEEIRAEGDAQAAKYLEQMGDEEELAIFLVWLDAFQNSLTEYGTFFLPSDTAPWHLVNRNAQLSASGIPQPINAYNLESNPAPVSSNAGEGIDNAVAEADKDSSHD